MAWSREWRLYFEANAKSLRQIPWDRGPELTHEERRAIARSVAEFQAGESSEGGTMLRYAREYAAKSDDLEYVSAIRLFIAEEQRHARDLERFLSLNGIPRVQTTFNDRVFRKLRHLFGGLEVSVGVLITAEIIAIVYYSALQEATRSAILRAICEQILADEARHVRFQSEQLAILRAGRNGLGRIVAMGLQRFLFLGTVPVVWLSHRRALRRGGLGVAGYWRRSWREFDDAFFGQANRRLQPSVRPGNEYT